MYGIHHPLEATMSATYPVVVIFNHAQGHEVHRRGCRDLARCEKESVLYELDVPRGAAGRRVIDEVVNYDFPDEPNAIRLMGCALGGLR